VLDETPEAAAHSAHQAREMLLGLSQPDA
jgi:hypothetical protein